MNEVLQLLESLSQALAAAAPEEGARALALRTRGWPPDKLENFFAVALGAGLLSHTQAAALLAAWQPFHFAPRAEDFPALARLKAEVVTLGQQQQQWQTEQAEIVRLQTLLAQSEIERSAEQAAIQTLTTEISRLENEMRQLDEWLAEVKV